MIFPSPTIHFSSVWHSINTFTEYLNVTSTQELVTKQLKVLLVMLKYRTSPR